MRTTLLPLAGITVALTALILPAAAEQYTAVQYPFEEPVILTGGAMPEPVAYAVPAPTMAYAYLAAAPMTMILPPGAVPVLVVPVFYPVPTPPPLPCAPTFPVLNGGLGDNNVIYFGGGSGRRYYHDYSSGYAGLGCNISSPVIYFGNAQRGHSFRYRR